VDGVCPFTGEASNLVGKHLTASEIRWLRNDMRSDGYTMT